MISKIPQNVPQHWNRNFKLLMIITILLQCCLMIHFGLSKPNLHCDEVWSFALANGNFPFIHKIDPSYFGIKLTKDFWNTLFTANFSEIFNLKPIWEYQSIDVHPPFYYALLHIISAFWNGKFSMMPAIILNLIFFIGTQFYLAKLVFKLSNNRWLMFVTILCYGFSLGAISTALTLRMYMMLTFFVVTNIYLNTQLIRQDSNYKHPFLKIAIVHTIGFLTMYYYVIFAFCSAVPVFAYYIVYRYRKAMLMYIGSGIVAIITSSIIFPAWIKQILLGGHNEHDAFGNLMNSPLAERTFILFNNLINGSGLFIFLMIIVIACAIAIANLILNVAFIKQNSGCIKLQCSLRKYSNSKLSLSLDLNTKFFTTLILLSCFIFSLLIIAKISLYFAEIRYVMPLIPIGVALIVFALFKLVAILQISNKHLIIAIFSLAMIIMTTTHSFHPSQIYWYWKDHKPIGRILKSDPDTLFITIQKNYNAWPVVSQGYNLVRSNSSYLLTEKELAKLKLENLNNPRSIIVWISYDLDQDKIEKRIKEVLNIKNNVTYLNNFLGRSFHYVYNKN